MGGVLELLRDNPFGDLNWGPMQEIIADEQPVLAQMSAVKHIINIADSSALNAVTTATLKNLPYTLFSEETGIDSVYHGLTARMRYFESAVMSLASFVHNVVFAVVFTVLAAVTFGQVQTLNDCFKREWTHTALSLGSVIVGLAGTAMPIAGVIGNGALAGVSIAAVLYFSQRDTIESVKGVYLRNQERFRNAGGALFNNDEGAVNELVNPLFTFIDRNIENVHTFEDLLPFVEGVARTLPAEIGDGIAGMLEGLGELTGLGNILGLESGGDDDDDDDDDVDEI